MAGTGPSPARPGVSGSPSGLAGTSPGSTAEPEESPILLAIRLEGEAQAVAIRAEAARRSEELVALAEAAADERVRRALADAGPAIAREANRIVNEARVRAIHRRTLIAADRLDGVFTEAARRLSEFASNPADPRWREALARLADEAGGFTGEGSSLAIGGGGACPADPPVCPVDGGSPDPAEGTPGAAGLDCDDEVRAGVVSRSRDGRLEVDATIETRLAQARLRMADEVARVLLGEEGP